MASLLMHETVASCVLRKIKISNLDRFRLGNIVADARNQNNTQQEKFEKKQRSHYLKSLGQNFLSVQYSNFFDKNKNGMEDEAVLGYYVHLLTDEIFLRKINDKYLDYLPDGEERAMKVQQYYRDLHRLNPHLIYEFGIRDNIDVEKAGNISLAEIDNGDEQIIMSEMSDYFKEGHLGNEPLELLDRAEMIQTLREIGDSCIKEITELGLREQREAIISGEGR